MKKRYNSKDIDMAFVKGIISGAVIVADILAVAFVIKDLFQGV